MRTFATIEDFEQRYGQVADDLKTVVETLLGDASGLVGGELSGTSVGWLDDESDEDVPRNVVALVCAIAYRCWRGQDGALAGVQRKQLGAAAITYRTVNAPGMWLTAIERRLVRQAAGLSAIGSVPLKLGVFADAFADDSEAGE